MQQSGTRASTRASRGWRLLQDMMEGCLQEDSAGGRAEGACWQAAGRAYPLAEACLDPKLGVKKQFPALLGASLSRLL